MPQAIVQPTGITVFGSALVRAEPDFAVVHVEVTRFDEQPAVALERTREALAEVRKAIRAAGIADASVQGSAMSVGARKRNYNDFDITGYAASVVLRVTVGDLEAVEQLVVNAVDAGAHGINGVEYHTARMKELRARARSEAVSAARAKAEVYATAAGVDVGAVLHIEDINPDRYAYASHGADIDLTPPPENDPSPDSQPGSLTISAAVMISYGIA